MACGIGCLSPYEGNAQEKLYWGIVADIGTSFNRTHGDTLTNQNLLLPTFALSVKYGKVIAHGISLQATLGYRNRGGIATINAEIDPTEAQTLGSYKVHARDHFLTNDLSLLMHAKYWKLFDHIPYINLTVRNDLYLLTNSKTTSNDAYFKPENSKLAWQRSRHHRPYVVGLALGTGIRSSQWELGLEYYHQLLGSFAIPALVRANYSQLFSSSMQLRAGYRF